jgi:hypothetical protein
MELATILQNFPFATKRKGAAFIINTINTST